MPHEIDSMGYTLETPWHGLGTRLNEHDSLDMWAREAGLSWRYGEAMVEYEVIKKERNWRGAETEVSDFLNYEDRKVIFRTDTDQPLSVVSRNYNVVQPLEVLEFYRDLIDEHGFKMDTAGSMSGGRKVWALARVGNDFEIDGDKVEGYLLLATSCDKTLATTAKFTAIRVVCSNTLMLAYYDVGKGSGIKQSHSMEFDPRAMKIDLGLVEETFSSFEEDVRRMKSVRLEDRVAMMAIMSVISGRDIHTVPIEEEIENPRLVKAVFDAYKEAPGAEDTPWGVVNAFTYHADHVRGRSTDTRLNSSWFGMAGKQKEQAFKKAIALAA